MSRIFDRTKLLIGEEGINILNKARVAIFGIGGVGSFTVEALARAGVGTLTLIDHDNVDITNINRQIHALHTTIGQAKVELMQNRIKDINPLANVKAIKEFCTSENISQLLVEEYDYIVDAIDTITGKLAIIEYAWQKQIPVISSMGAANKLNNTGFQVVDISETRVCPLAKVIRKELRARGIYNGLKVVYSPEQPIKPNKFFIENNSQKRELPGSISYVPSTAGLIIAGEVINDLVNK